MGGIALALEAAAPIMTGIAGYQEAQGQKQQAEINAYIGRTRAIQTDTSSREGLNSQLANMRATFAANGQKPGVGAMEMLKEARRVSGRDRRIQYGNRMQEAADWKMAAKNAGNSGKNALLGGFIKAGPSLFDLYDYYKK